MSKEKFALSSFLLLMSLVLTGCSAPRGVKFISHRGESIDAPENTVAACRLAMDRDTDGLEFDLHLTADRKIVVAHDWHTERMSGVKLTIGEVTAVELRQLDVGGKKNPKFAGEKIPFFAEIAALRQPGRQLFAEIKCGRKIIPVLKQEVAELRITPAEIIFISFHDEVLAELKRQMPAFKTYLLMTPKVENGTVDPGAATLIEKLKAIGADGADVKALPEIDREYVDKVKSAGFEFHVWTIDDVETARRFMEYGVDSITSNRAAELKAELLR